MFPRFRAPETMTASEQAAILAGYRRFLNGLPYPLQILVRVGAPLRTAGDRD